MGLLLSKESNAGITGNYWKIVDFGNSVLSNSGYVKLALYKDKATSDAGKGTMQLRDFEWRGSDNPFTLTEMDKVGTNCIKLAYEKIKADEADFSSATDA